jgi:hypothetical protein
MPFTIALGAIPWKMILTTTPPIVSEARKLYEVISKDRSTKNSSPTVGVTNLSEVSKTLSELRLRVEEMEAHDAKQAELISQIAHQGEALSQGLKILASRMTILIWMAASAIIVAVIALVVAALK